MSGYTRPLLKSVSDSLTDNQIRLAIEAGLVEIKQVRNPNYSSGPPATILKVEDITRNMDSITAYRGCGI
jgi:hypothetical protein